ncbi:hypothetical protein AVEN_227014-1 [Araneus ventricosus]|uniref:Helitron helicase-like domain-containing protein n=1 Tax=Araneus ventricosus TaxID=182803 RepID=A0A4Y2TR75_ARAVE|nr:hypothetical protein AVEN_227014-1 [Araneus ventricosus]
MLREVESRVIAESNEEGEDVPVVNMVFRCDRHSNQRRYNAPTANEIAMSTGFCQQRWRTSIRKEHLRRPVWQPNWRCESYQGAQGNQSRVTVTILQYKSALSAVIDDFNPIISAGKLTQQWTVGSYLQVEANNPNFIRTHQQQLRTELYQGLADRNSSNPALII